jgi:phosphoribosyl 1,2-cyclic phosphate phosphodiesterase
MRDRLKVTILGCGSSGGVPRGDGDWGACDPGDPRNRRRRCSALIQRIGPGGETNVLIDTSPDLREQALAAGLRHVDGVIYTHDHADQTHGIDDLRVFAMRSRRRLPAWMDAQTREALTGRFGYIFESVQGYPAIVEAYDVPPHGTSWSIDGPGGPVPVTTFDQGHGPIRSVGVSCGPVSYSSDVDALDDAALDAVRGSALWIVDALRFTPHPTHGHLDRALEWIASAEIERAVLTNLHIDMDYRVLTSMMPLGVEVAVDGWSAELTL